MRSFNGDFPPWRCSGRQRRRGGKRERGEHEIEGRKKIMVVACVSGKPTTIGTIHSLGGANQDNSIVCFIFLIACDLYISGSFS